MEPTPEKIAELKEKYPDRELHIFEAVERLYQEEEVKYVFLMTGANRDEYRKYSDDMRRAGDLKPEDRLTALRAAMENNVLAQIRWPDRDEVKEFFRRHPVMVDTFAEKLRDTAGGSIELRAKKS